jgi:hypothetical protein
MSAKEREKYLAEKKAKRAELQDKINDLSAKRALHIKMELEKKGKPADGFDAKVVESLRAEAKNKGLTY